MLAVRQEESLKVLYVGCKPLTEKQQGFQAFDGSRSGRELDRWHERIFKNFPKHVEVYRLNALDRLNEPYRPTVHDVCTLRFRVVNLCPDVVYSLGKVSSATLEQASCCTFYALPHPSGLNRLLNDQSYLSARLLDARHFAIRRVKWG